MSSQQTYDNWFHQNIKSQIGNFDYDWNDTGVDLVLDNITNHEEVAIQQTLDFFSSIDAPHLKEGSIRKMFSDYTYPTAMKAIIDMLNLSEYDWKRVIGENGSKIYAGIRVKMTDIPLHVLMGSLPFFGRGVGKRRFKKLEIAFGTKALHELGCVNKLIVGKVKGFNTTTVDKIYSGLDDYYTFYKQLPDYVNILPMKDTSGGVLDGQKVCFTGFRNPSLQQAVEENGGEVSTTVSGKTSFVVAKDPNSTSGKVKTARAKNIKIISIDDLEDMLSTD